MVFTYFQVFARWVPRLLKDMEKQRRVTDSTMFSIRYAREGTDFLNRIITTDETWLWYFDPETKAQSSQWVEMGTPPPEKARVNKCGGKTMYVMFADRRGMILSHAVPKDQSVNAEYYSKVLRRHLVQALRKKRPNIPIEDFILHQDNASPHTAESTTLEIDLIGFNTIRHPPYSPDLAPFDFAIFPEIKKHLKGRRFSSVKDIRVATNKIISNYDSQWYEEIFQKWIDRHEKCIFYKGEYFEKK